MKLPVVDISMDGGTQPRSTINTETVQEYADLLSAGVCLPPVIVFYDGNEHWLADGFHRVQAALQIGLGLIEADVTQGTLADAQWFSFGANKSHGLRRTNEDKQRAVKAALAHANGASRSNRQIAEHIGVDEGTVRSWREKLTAELPQSAERIGRDGRTINTANIGRSKPLPVSIDSASGKNQEPITSTPQANQAPVKLSPAKVWSCQVPKHFRNEVLRLVKAFEKANPPIDQIVIERRNGVPTGVEVICSLEKEKVS